MDRQTLKRILDDVSAGKLDVDDAVECLAHLPFEVTEFATVDHHRSLRCGFGEVIYCPGKTVGQIVAIFEKVASGGPGASGPVLATRADENIYRAVAEKFPRAEYDELARAITLRPENPPAPTGRVAIVAAGTSDLPVAQEARVTAEMLGAEVSTHYDVGVAGLHRLLAHLGELRKANIIVVVAGMEGALASVVGGLVAVPVVAVPTSVGYGASFAGVAALLTMLNSCASNVTVVNIDNGFGGGYVAAMINRQATASK